MSGTDGAGTGRQAENLASGAAGGVTWAPHGRGKAPSQPRPTEWKPGNEAHEGGSDAPSGTSDPLTLPLQRSHRKRQHRSAVSSFINKTRCCEVACSTLYHEQLDVLAHVTYVSRHPPTKLTSCPRERKVCTPARTKFVWLRTPGGWRADGRGRCCQDVVYRPGVLSLADRNHVDATRPRDIIAVHISDAIRDPRNIITTS